MSLSNANSRRSVHGIAPIPDGSLSDNAADGGSDLRQISGYYRNVFRPVTTSVVSYIVTSFINMKVYLMRSLSENLNIQRTISNDSYTNQTKSFDVNRTS